MKKLLLLGLFLAGSAASAQQVYWEEKPTGFLNQSTTQGAISYAQSGGGEVVWAYGRDGSGNAANYQIWSRSLDGGSTWTNGVINVGNTTLGIGNIHAVSATTAYVSVFPNNATTVGGIWRTTDSGATWTKQATALFSTLGESFTNLVHFWDANVGFCQGDPQGGYFELYTTTNGGTNWTRVPSGNIPTPLTGEYGYTGNYETFSGGGVDVIWFGTNMGRIYKSTDKGLTWSVSQSPISDFGGTVNASYAMKNATEGIMISSDWQFFRTVNGAVTWNAEFPGGEYYRNFDVAFVPGTTNMYVSTGLDIDEVGRGSSYSLDNGDTWVDINNIDVEAVDGGGQLEFFDYAHGLASGFNASPTIGGIWKWLAPSMAVVDFKNQSPYTIAPNPTTGNIEIAGKQIANVTAFDILGKQVVNQNFGSLDNVSVNLSSLNAGVYMVKVTNQAGAATTIKVVKQ